MPSFPRPEAASLESMDRQAKEFAFSCAVLGWARTVCLIGALVPVLGDVLGVVQEILGDVEKYHGLAQAELEGAGRFMLHTVEYIEQLVKVVEGRIGASRETGEVALLRERIQGLEGAIDAYQTSVAKFGTVIAGVVGLQAVVAGVEKAKKRLADELNQVNRLYDLTRDTKTLDLLYKLVQLLLDQRVVEAPKGGDYNSNTDETLAKELCAAVLSLDLDSIRRKLRDGANPNLLVHPRPDSANVQDMVPATHLACKKGRVDVLRLLLEEGRANPNVRDGNNRTLLEYAVHRNELSCVEYAVTVPGIDLESRDQQEYTPLITAARDDKRHDILKVLVGAGAKLLAKNGIRDQTTTEGYTALEEAQRKGAHQNAEYLANSYRSRIDSELTKSVEELSH
eukprot:CAMPEP_0197395330 /NCGR_PEP_ID=MMETSP1165-20131217/6758_1 /TAXON_ID=284809 /ORGANISM="Chrysocystis fragilis, Strain CCMP3189" /LENGTH=395 /DNA_ID=CAMNT_0042921091 /DNA_START=38 /DNA_END=1225 /DNA_ORIENTATION=+